MSSGRAAASKAVTSSKACTARSSVSDDDASAASDAEAATTDAASDSEADSDFGGDAEDDIDLDALVSKAASRLSALASATAAASATTAASALDSSARVSRVLGFSAAVSASEASVNPTAQFFVPSRTGVIQLATSGMASSGAAPVESSSAYMRASSTLRSTVNDQMKTLEEKIDAMEAEVGGQTSVISRQEIVKLKNSQVRPCKLSLFRYFNLHRYYIYILTLYSGIVVYTSHRTVHLTALLLFRFCLFSFCFLQRKDTAGKMWFDLPATTVTPEIARDLALIKARSAINRTAFMRRDNSATPKYFQMGTLIEGAFEPHNRLSRKDRKRTLAEEILSDSTTMESVNARVAQFSERSKRTDKNKSYRR